MISVKDHEAAINLAVDIAASFDNLMVVQPMGLDLLARQSARNAAQSARRLIVAASVEMLMLAANVARMRAAKHNKPRLATAADILDKARMAKHRRTHRLAQEAIRRAAKRDGVTA